MHIIKSLTLTSIFALSAIGLSACGGGEGEIASAEPLPKIEAPAGTEWHNMVAKTEENGYVIGNPDAPIKLIEFAALTCGACAAFEHEAYAEIIEDYVGSGRVSFEIRNYSLNPYDLVLGILTRCGPTESYPALTEQIFKNQASILNNIDQSKMQAAFANAESEGYAKAAQAMGVIEFFKERGISEDQANACLADKGKIQELIELTEKGNSKYNVEGTPTFYLNGVKIDYSGWASVKSKLQEAGAR